LEKEASANPKLITVLTLSYNSPDLFSAIDSVLGQDYERIQYVLVDDSSEDFSKAAVHSYIQAHQSRNIEECIIVQNPENFGTVRSANIGLSHARGEYIFFLAGDDVFASQLVISSWVAAFEESGALVMTAYRNDYDNTLTHYLGRMPMPKQVHKIRTLPPAELFECIAEVNFILGCCMAYSRSCFDEHGIFDERYRLIEDHSMILRLLRQDVPITFFDYVTVNYRIGGSSSGINYNEVYERDVDLIFEHEISPYVQNKRRATKAYKKWKSKQQLAKETGIRLRNAQGRPILSLFLKLWYYAHHPIDSLRGLLANPVKIKKLLRNT